MWKLLGIAVAGAVGVCSLSSTGFAQGNESAAGAKPDAGAQPDAEAQPDEEGTPRDHRQFAKQGQVVLSAERLTGLSFLVTTEFESEGETAPGNTRTSFSLFGSSSAAGVFQPVALPRITADVFFDEGWSVGGAVLGDYATNTDSTPTIWFAGLTARMGWAIPLTDSMAFWPKAGLTFSYGQVNETEGAPETRLREYLLAATIDLSFVFEVVEHFGVTLTPSGDLPFMTKTSVGTHSFNNSASVWAFGLTAGLLGWF
jgi:hypothetical protein